MIGNQQRWQEDLFIAAPLSSLVPDDHILKQVDKILDLSWLRKEVAHLYCSNNGRPGIDPEAAIRLMLAGYFQGIVHDRKLMREAQVNLAIRWFAGYRLDEKLPDHSSLTRIRQRFGPEFFEKIFLRIVSDCVNAGLVGGETVHIDATLIRADVSWESLVTEHVESVIESNDNPPKRGRPKNDKPKTKKKSTTDPDATMTTSSHSCRMEPSYKQHGAVDDKAGIIVDVNVTTGEQSEGKQLLEQIDRIESNIGQKIDQATADAGYSHGVNYKELHERDIDAIIPPQRMGKKSAAIPSSKFSYDTHNEIVKCPGGKILHKSSENEKGCIYRARKKDCKKCPLRDKCFSVNSSVRTVLISHGYEYLLRSRRRMRNPDPIFIEMYSRHRWMVEGMHGEAKTQHGLRRAVRRGMANVAIQSYLTATVINLKRLAKALLGLYHAILIRNLLLKTIFAFQATNSRFLSDLKLISKKRRIA